MSAEELDAIDDELLKAIARVKGHAVQKAVPKPVSEIYPLSAVAAKAWLKAEKEAPENLEPGRRMPDGTVYVGKRKILSRTFNIFAAQEDLPEPMQYVDAVKYIAREYTAHGYAGGNFRNDKVLYAAIKDGSYNGEWVIPPREFMNGEDANGKKVMPDNIFSHKDKGSFTGTFKKKENGHPDARSIFLTWYWSSTENPDQNSILEVSSVSLTHGEALWSSMINDRQSCRPVRLVPCK